MADYATVTQVKAHAPEMVGTSTTYDAILTSLVTRASRAIDTFTLRAPDAYKVASTSTRYFDGSGCAQLWVDEMAAAPTAVSVAESGVIDDSGGTGGTYTAWSASDYLLWPYNAPDWRQPYLRIDIDGLNGTKATWYRYRKAIKITAKFGFSETVPPEIEEATIIQTTRWFMRGKQGFMDESAFDIVGQLSVLRLDPDIVQMVRHFMRAVI
jgi:hypothetical protein